MKIVVLDPIYLNDELTACLRSMGCIHIYDAFPSNSSEVINRIKDAQIIITASTNIDRDIIKSCPDLIMISLASSGHNRIDLEAANEKGILVTNVPGYATDAVAEHVFAMLLSFLKRVHECDTAVRKGDFDWRKYKSLSLKDMTFGIVGFGRIGKRVEALAIAFGCKILIYDVKFNKSDGRKFVTLNELLTLSDIISLHVPLSSDTENMINKKEFQLMEKKPIIINTARGKIINYNALIEALNNGLISGACLDVFYEEPLSANDPLLRFPNLVLSPHNAFFTEESTRKCTEIVLSNIKLFLNGHITNLVNNPRYIYSSSKIND